MPKRSERNTPSFRGLQAASSRASAAARGSSRKRDTRCELALRRELWHMGLRYRLAPTDLPGQPDIVFRREKVAVFCDGDFWHGRNLNRRLQRLSKGHNSPYWVAKIQRNVERDHRRAAELHALGWEVMRLWETDILKSPMDAAKIVKERVLGRR